MRNVYIIIITLCSIRQLPLDNLVLWTLSRKSCLVSGEWMQFNFLLASCRQFVTQHPKFWNPALGYILKLVDSGNSKVEKVAQISTKVFLHHRFLKMEFPYCLNRGRLTELTYFTYKSLSRHCL